MKTWFYVGILALVGSLAGAAPEPAPPALDRSTPEATIRSFVLASNRMEARAVECIVGGKVDDSLLEWEKEIRTRSEGQFLLTVVQVQSEVVNEEATAKVLYGVLFGGDLVRMEDTLKLRRADSIWKIVPPTLDEVRSLVQQPQKGPGLFPILLSTYSYPKLFIMARRAARLAGCISNMKMLRTGMEILLLDYDQKFTLKGEQLRKVLRIHAGDEKYFHCPQDVGDSDSYSVNEALFGLNRAQIKQPGETVMIYEGKNSKLNFRHDGKAVVVLVDGTVKAVDAAEAMKLRWKP